LTERWIKIQFYYLVLPAQVQSPFGPGRRR
jgi:hypothetical protein